MTLKVAAALALAAAAAGCGAGEKNSAEPNPTGSWQLVSGTSAGGRIETSETHRITLVLERERVGGTAGCNSYGGPAQIDGDRFDVSDLSRTDIGCDPPIMAAEDVYLDALGRVDTIRRQSAQLVLEGPSVELRFDRTPAVPTRQLLEMLWELDTVVEGDVASTPVDVTATLRLGGDGGLEGETGCRTFRGRYVLRGDEIRVTNLAADDAATAGVCAEAAVEQERIVLQVLGDGFRAEVEGDRLVLTAGPYGLIYRAA